MNKNKILTSVMCASTLMTSVLPVFSTQTLTNDTLSNLEDTEVLYSKSATYMVTIPKNITLGSEKSATYSVKVSGDISSDQEVYVAPVDTISETDNIDFYMEDQSTSVLKKDNVKATVTPTKTVWNFAEVASATEVTDNSISATDLTSGSWKGVFNFEINLKTLENAIEYTPFKLTYSNYTQTGLTSLEGDINIPSTFEYEGINYKITSIGGNAFDGNYMDCSNITSITIPSTVTEIREGAFNNLNDIDIYIPSSVISFKYGPLSSGTLTIHYEGTEEQWNAIEILGGRPSSTTTVVYNSKHNYDTEFTIDIEPTCTTVGSKSQHCTICDNKTNVTEIAATGHNYVNDICTNCNQEREYTPFTLSSSNYTQTGLTSLEGDVVIPEKFEYEGTYYKVTSIADSAFKNNTSITSITIPNSVTTLYSNAFNGCTNLTDITIPNSVNQIFYDVFSNTPWLLSKQQENPFVIINGILIDASTASGDIVIPSNVTCIGYEAFNRNQNITSVNIPNNVTTIKSRAFGNCENLTNVYIPNSVIEIIAPYPSSSNSPFYGCSSTLILYCEVDSKQSGWGPYWNYYESERSSYNKLEVAYNTTRAEYEALINNN